MSHQSWLEQPYTNAARDDEDYEYWCRHIAEDAYQDLLDNGDEERNIPYHVSKVSIRDYKVSGALPSMRTMTFDQWMADQEEHWPYYEEWAEEAARHPVRCRCPDCDPDHHNDTARF